MCKLLGSLTSVLNSIQLSAKCRFILGVCTEPQQPSGPEAAAQQPGQFLEPAAAVPPTAAHFESHNDPASRLYMLQQGPQGDSHLHQ